MISVVLKILSILGILLLCLLGLVLFIILLVLFFPIRYRIIGKKNAENISVSVRVSWLLGLLRVLFDFPDPGKITVKILPFTVFDSKVEKKVQESVQDVEKTVEEAKESAEHQAEEAILEEKPEKTGSDQTGQKNSSDNSENDQTGQNTDSPEMKNDQTGQDGVSEEKKGFFKKIEKLKYTIRNIYDKIKNVWENISYYIELLREEETKQLFHHAMFRVGKILKSIRPRRIKGNILFGTGAPDTTGYAYGAYGMLSPFLGDKLLVTPDFSQTIFEGDIYISGHITIFTILWNVLRLLLDKKLRRFIRKMKTGRKK